MLMMSRRAKLGPNEPLPAARLILYGDEVAAMLGISTKTLRRWVGDRKFPPPMKTPGEARWSRLVVERFVNEVNGDVAAYNRLRRTGD